MTEAAFFVSFAKTNLLEYGTNEKFKVNVIGRRAVDALRMWHTAAKGKC